MNVIVKEKADDIEIIGSKISGAQVEVGTPINDLPLPQKVETDLEDGTSQWLDVIWGDSHPDYDQNEVGQYIFTGEFVLIDGIANSGNHKATFTITVVDSSEPVIETFVFVSYVDEDGNELAPGVKLTGEVGEAYSTEAKEIDGYTLKEVPHNATGVFTEQDIEVVYVYEEVTEEPTTDKEISKVPVFGTAIGVGTKDLTEVRTLLPSTVEVELEDGSLVELEVTWSQDSNPVYDMNKVGAYIFTGEFVLTEGIINPAEHKVEYWVNLVDSDEVFDPKEPEQPKDDADDPKDPSAKDGSDGSGKSTEKTDAKEIKKADGKGLPKTATPYYTMLLAGLLLMLSGAAFYMIRKKRVK